MPVQRDGIDRRVVVLGELALAVQVPDPGDQAHADENVDAVQAGHHEVETEETPQVIRNHVGSAVFVGESDGSAELLVEVMRTLRGLRAVEVRAPEELTRQRSNVELVGVLEVLHDHERAGAQERDDQEDARVLLTAPLELLVLGNAFLLADLSGAHGHRRRPTRDEQHDRVECTHLPIEQTRPYRPSLGVPAAEDEVGDEETAEEQDLLAQEEPHADLRSLELLLRRVEVMGQEVGPVMRVITHGSGFLCFLKVLRESLPELFVGREVVVVGSALHHRRDRKVVRVRR